MNARMVKKHLQQRSSSLHNTACNVVKNEKSCTNEALLHLQLASCMLWLWSS